jgi:hypothetical protein
MNPAQQLSIVYVLTNPAMPGLVKIGRTANEDVLARLNQLYTTGVPFPFQLEFACKVANPVEVEVALHTAFGPQRVNQRREFFQIDPGQAVAILRLLHTEDATTEIQHQVTTEVDTQVDQNAAEAFRARNPNLDFEKLGIPVGAELRSTRSNDTLTVAGPRKVNLGGQELFLSAASRQVLGLEFDGNAAHYWTYNGRTLRELYNEVYTPVD